MNAEIPEMLELPLAGIRVVDLSRVFAMPYAGAHLADMGAEVIKVDTHHAAFVDTTRTLTGPYPDNVPGSDYWNRAGTFQTLNRGKRSVTLDLRSDRGMDLLLELVAVSDIVLENFTPRVTRRFGLDYPSLRAVRPDLVLVSNTGYGHSGPWSDFGAMASALEPTHAAGAYMGYLETGDDGRQASGNTPNKIGNSYTDFLACWSAQVAVLASLYRRALTGRSVWIDLAMYQTGVSFFGAGLLDFAFNGRRTRRLGNRHQHMAPHGCYPCQGHDRWVTLAARDDDDWQALCRCMGKPDLMEDPRFHSQLDRHRNQEDLDALIGSWTSELDQESIVATLNDAGVPAAPALDAGQLLNDPHLGQRGFFERVEHPDATGLGTRDYAGRGWRLGSGNPRIRGPAPDLGSDNESLLSGLLGVEAEEVRDLAARDVIGEELLPAAIPNVVPLARQRELGWIADFVTDYQARHREQ